MENTEILKLHSDSNEFALVINHRQKQLTVRGTGLVIYTKDFGYGDIAVCSYTDVDGKTCEVDMFGKNINARNYSPLIADEFFDIYPSF